MRIHRWTEKEEEIFKPQRAFMRYFNNKPLLKNYNIAGRVDEKETEVKNLYALTLLTVKELKLYIKENPEFLAKDIDDKKVVNKIISKLVEKVAKEI